MNMVFCRKCGKEIDETARFCPVCGAPQGTPQTSNQIGPLQIDHREPTSDSWERTFTLIEKAGGAKIQNIKRLPVGEQIAIWFNVWALLFGPLYYVQKGMWKKAISLLGASGLFFFALEAIGQTLGFTGSTTAPVVAIYFCARANIDYYRKVKLGDNGWW